MNAPRKHLAIALIIASVQSAGAMDYSYRMSGQHVVIDAKGQIEPDESTLFLNWTTTLPPEINRLLRQPGNDIVFNSPGGFVAGGFGLGKIIEEWPLATGVAAHGECLSACMLAWAAGVRKSAPRGVCLGVHHPTADATAQLSPAQSVKQAADATDETVTWLHAHGALDTVLYELPRTPPEEIIHCLLFDELMAWGVNLTD